MARRAGPGGLLGHGDCPVKGTGLSLPPDTEIITEEGRLHALCSEGLQIDDVSVFDIEPVLDRRDRRHAPQHLERHLHGSLRLRQQH